MDLFRGLGWMVPVAVLLPNIVWAVLPAGASPATPKPVPPHWVRWVEVVEWVGRMAVLVLPVFSQFRLGTAASVLAGEVMFLALAFYYTGWARYFTRGRTAVLLYKPLFGVPLPMAVSPAVYFLAASAPLRSVPLAVAAVVFGAAHVAVGRFEYESLWPRSRST